MQQVMVIPDATKDKRFASNPHVIVPGGIRFYCGAPLIASNGHRLGTLWVPQLVCCFVLTLLNCAISMLP